jgi:hypothetical protein
MAERSGISLMAPSILLNMLVTQLQPEPYSRRSLMRYVGLHTLPGFTKEMLAAATPMLDKQEATFVRAYTGFQEGKVVCEWEATNKEQVVRSYSALGFPSTRSC